MDEKKEKRTLMMAMLWYLYMLIHQVATIQALVWNEKIKYGMKKSTLFVVTCDLLWRNKHVICIFFNVMWMQGPICTWF